MNQLHGDSADRASEVLHDLVDFSGLIIVEEIVRDGTVRVDHVIEDGFTVTNHFSLSVGQHRDRPIWVLVDEGRFIVLLLQRVDLSEVDISASHLADGKEGTRVLAEIISPNHNFLTARSHILRRTAPHSRLFL